MSSSRTYLLHCDSMVSDQCEGTFANADMCHKTANEQRKEAQKKWHGWKRFKGEDICRECWMEINPKQKEA